MPTRPHKEGSEVRPHSTIGKKGKRTLKSLDDLDVYCERRRQLFLPIMDVDNHVKRVFKGEFIQCFLFSSNFFSVPCTNAIRVLKL